MLIIKQKTVSQCLFDFTTWHEVDAGPNIVSLTKYQKFILKTNKRQRRTCSLSDFDALTNVSVIEGFFKSRGSRGEGGIKESS